MKSIFTVSIIGCGSRGCDAYGQLINQRKDCFKIVSLCDLRKNRVERFGTLFNVKKENLFTDEESFFAEKRSDALIIATQDQDHVRMCLKAMELGYKILLEKPITASEEELKALMEAYRRYNATVMVCHVLRYAPAFVKIKEILGGNAIGRLVFIEALEQVSFWHQAHSYVRGKWRKEEDTSPMILAKCCHDLDLLQYYADSLAREVYSVGDLSYFKKENQPKGAATRCAQCKYIESCPYSAENIYVGRWKNDGCPEDAWPFNVVAIAPLAEEKIRKAYSESEYGQCVFACDNNVVDNQTTCISFENGVKAVLTMTAFTNSMGRKMTFHGTLGEIKFDEGEDILQVCTYGKKVATYKVSDIVEEVMRDSFGHGGGDYGIVNAFYDLLNGEQAANTSLEQSAESHYMGIAAEQSRKSGNAVQLKTLR